MQNVRDPVLRSCAEDFVNDETTKTTKLFEPSASREPLTRRRFIARTGIVMLGLTGAIPASFGPAFASSPAETKPASPLPVDLLESSPFVYISPLLADGRESRCHAELWYAWLDDSIVVTVSSDRWKAKALARGLDRARIWVGDHGRWKRMFGGPNEGFRKAPRFDARAERIADPKMIDRLLAVYSKKYPAEIAVWRERMKTGSVDGSRQLIRYRLNA